ncbi:GGDEF domain-containing protein [Candidatus Symbiobacter mobilis]|uniref:diguanylate cyclase n=1 Tax=Candidatus Symbiobacter mobilis CR TaxID=946483 RepID=U5N9J5_9BURK|nr:GGDEF domain-containing protein [Candidatus Symbiobacter mobilis]AGX86839.1 GGDEF domain protein [Candidatus Symbiobacter mobilis CR]
MLLDVNTLLVVTVANIVTLALVSPAVMGLRLGAAARAARWSIVVHAVGWACMIASNFWPETWMDRWLSTMAVAGFAVTHWLLYVALAHWLGPRRFRPAVIALSILTPVGYFAVFGSYALRVGWANLLLAVQLLLVTWACFRPTTTLHGPWRMVLAGGMTGIAVLTAGRGVLGAFTDVYPTFLTPHPWNIAAMFLTSLLPVLMNFAVLGGWHEEAETALHKLAITDTLTGLLNRRGWHEVALPLIAHASRLGQPVSLLMIDIDFFKSINDRYGHDAGDRALQAMGALLRENRRAHDVAARIGGEEFCLLLPSCTAEAASDIDQRLRQRLPAIGADLGFPLDFSAGLAVRQPQETLERLMTRADTALYAAKDGGRGCLVSAESPSPQPEKPL